MKGLRIKLKYNKGSDCMKVAIGSDFSGFRLKEAVRVFLENEGYDIVDVGQTNEKDQLLYYEAAVNVSKAIQSGQCQRGILFCGSGAGVSLVANKHKGVYCVTCETLYTAEKIQLINNCNVLAMGEKIVSPIMGGEMAKAFLDAKWCDGFEEQRRKNNERGFAVLQELEG